MFLNSSHNQHFKTKLSKVLAPDKLLFCSVVFIYVMKALIHPGNKASHVYSQCKHMVCQCSPMKHHPSNTTAAQGSVLCLILFNFCIIEPDDRTMCILSKSAEVAKLGGITNRPQGCHSQSDRERRKKEALKSFMKVNKLRCKVLLLGRNTPRHQPGSPIWKAALRKGTWGQKGEYEPSLCCFSILQHLMVYAVSRMGEVILPLCAVLLQANLDYCVQFWAFQYKRGIDILHTVQGRPQRWRNLRIARWQL